MRKAVFLDRDGVINKDKAYVYRIKDFEFMSGVVDALKILQNNDFLLFIVTNQSGIAREYYKEEDFKIVNEFMLEQLQKQEITIDYVNYCPHHVEGTHKTYSYQCECRKPKAGMLIEILSKFDIDIESSFMIGDNERDIEAGKKVKLKTIRVSQDDIKSEADFIVKNLYDAVTQIICD